MILDVILVMIVILLIVLVLMIYKKFNDQTKINSALINDVRTLNEMIINLQGNTSLYNNFVDHIMKDMDSVLNRLSNLENK